MKTRYLTSVGIGLCALFARAADSTWLGVSSSWSDANNWSLGAVPASSGNQGTIFSGSTEGIVQPSVDVNQPMGSSQLQKLTFNSSGWIVSGPGAITLSKGNVDLGNGLVKPTNPFIDVKEPGSIIFRCPLIFTKGNANHATLGAVAGAMVQIEGTISFTSAGKANMDFAGGGTYDVRSTINCGDLRICGGSTMLFNNPNGSLYGGTVKLRLNNGTGRWMQDNQFGPTSCALLRIDNGAIADLNGHEDSFPYIQSALDSTSGGVVSTGDDGQLTLTSVGTILTVGSNARIPTDTTIISGNLHMGAELYKRPVIRIRRGSEPVDLILDCHISGECGLEFHCVENIANVAGISVMRKSNSYKGETRISQGTLRLEAPGEPMCVGSKVTVNAAGRLEGCGNIACTQVANTVSVSGVLAPGGLVGGMVVGADGAPNGVTFNSESKLAITRVNALSPNLTIWGPLSTSGTVTLDFSEMDRKTPAGRYTLILSTSAIPAFSSVNGLGETWRLRVSEDKKKVSLDILEMATVMYIR